ncbi:hypothetical protein CUMW_225940 [Citrus unshiu]|uniref:Serine-threonine/tyrosine-protein kinase catalytic domain-containing protein n=1 Tax=Citrus unshiu TaxID=55188 RepID=A0A2H5QGX8_CITUN|nr:hypothetical protein CUMW_225940 [Citrus unshiu]
MDYKDTNVTHCCGGAWHRWAYSPRVSLPQGVEELIQVALLCTQGSPSRQAEDVEVVKMLEGDGLAERWGQWQTAEFSSIA